MISSERYCLSCGAANPPGAEACFACGLSLKITAPLLENTTSKNNRPLLQQRYRILSQVGKGGFSAVYKAEDTLFDDHLVAIKAISLSGLQPHEVIEATEAFNREMMLLSGVGHSDTSLKHPNLPRIYGHFSDVECWYLVMDFIEGTTLEAHLETVPNARLPVGEVLEIALLLCTVLEYLHTRQPPIIFRDLKPANIMLRPDGRIALIDFGIARQFRVGQARDTMPFGSPGYAAPEQYGKTQTTTRTDIYSLGVILHQLLSGNDPSLSPFHFAPLQLQDQSILAGLETLIMQMLELDAAKRPASIVIVKQQLKHIAHAWFTRHVYGVKAQSPPRSPAGAPVSWQSIMPPASPAGGTGVMNHAHTGSSLAAQGGGVKRGQMLLLRQPAPGPGVGGFRAATSYWSMPAPQKKRNWMAVASLSLGFFSIFVPLFSCGITTVLAERFNADGPQVISILPALLLIVPAILAIVFGHIGKHRANTIPAFFGSRDIAVTGMVIGYIFGSIYLLMLLIILVFFFAFS